MPGVRCPAWEVLVFSAYQELRVKALPARLKK